MSTTIHANGRTFSIYRDMIMHRVWWGWFAISLLRIPLHELATKSYDWRLPNGRIYRPGCD